MKVKDAEQLHAYLISQWLYEENPKRDDLGVLSFDSYLRYAREKRPDCVDFKCRSGAEYQIEMWFDSKVGQTFIR